MAQPLAPNLRELVKITPSPGRRNMTVSTAAQASGVVISGEPITAGARMLPAVGPHGREGFPMRRLFVLLAGVVSMSASMGCCHVAGKCDCTPPVQPCCIYGLYPPAFGLPVLPPSSPVTATTTQTGADARSTPTDATPIPTTTPMKEIIGLPREL